MKRIVTLVTAVIMITAVSLVVSGCGTDDIDISRYAGEEILLRGLEKDDITISVEELKGMDCRTVKTHSTSDKIGKVKATGPELGTLLEQYGLNKEDIKSVKIYGSDGYDVPLMAGYINEHDIYLAFGIDGEPLDAESAPCRVIIPGSDSAYWIRMVNRIEFEKSSACN